MASYFSIETEEIVCVISYRGTCAVRVRRRDWTDCAVDRVVRRHATIAPAQSSTRSGTKPRYDRCRTDSPDSASATTMLDTAVSSSVKQVSWA